MLYDAVGLANTLHFCFNAAMVMGRMARIAQIMLLQPLAIVVLALLINRERIRLETVLVAAAIVPTVLIGQRMRIKRS